MTDDDKALVERLRDGVLYGDARLHNPKGHNPLRMEAADRIEALSAENERLREALRSAIRNIENLTYDIKSHTECAECQNNVAMYEHAVEEYRAALGDTDFKKLANPTF